MRKASARVRGLKRGGPRFSKLGGLENHSDSTGRCDVLVVGLTGRHAILLTPGEGGPGCALSASREQLHPGGQRLAAAAFVPLGVDPHPQGVFPLRVIVVMTWPVVALLEVVHELVCFVKFK